MVQVRRRPARREVAQAGRALSEAVSGRAVEPIVVVQAAEHRRRRNTAALWQAEPVLLEPCRQTLGRIGKAWSQARMRAGTVVVRHPLPEHPQQMPRVDRHERVQAFPAARPDEPLHQRIARSGHSIEHGFYRIAAPAGTYTLTVNGDEGYTPTSVPGVTFTDGTTQPLNLTVGIQPGWDIASITLDPTTVDPSGTVTGTITLIGPAPSRLTFDQASLAFGRPRLMRPSG